MFLMHAKEYLSLGLAAIPCGAKRDKPEGKVPLVAWKKFESRLPTTQEVESLIRRHPRANIGIVTGSVSGITVLDVDDISGIQSAIKTYGDTPLKVSTPRGMHLYYRYNGERNGIKINGQLVDIRGDGGFIVSPPSINLVTRAAYVFLEGNYGMVGSLPCMNGLSCLSQGIGKAPMCHKSIAAGEVIPAGERNARLFKYLKDKAFKSQTINELMDDAVAINNLMLDPALPELEVIGIVKSVWGYKTAGRLITSGTQYAAITKDELNCLKDEPVAFLLWSYLKYMHSGLRITFNIPSIYTSAQLLCDKRTLKYARNILIERGLIDVVRLGGRGQGSQHVYRFKG